MQETKVYIFNPSVKTGGTNNLLGNLAILLSDNPDYSVYYIDYLDSPVKNIVLSKNKKIYFVEIKENKRILVQEGIIISILLSLKTILKEIEINNNTRILLWSTHPDDALKLLPSFNLWLRLPINTSKVISSIIHPFYKKRLKKFLYYGKMSNGIVWMDKENVEINQHFYNLEGEFPILRIFTGIPSNQIVFNENTYDKSLKIVILGRLTNFKVYPMKGFLEQFKIYQETSNKEIYIDFIGNGPLRNLLTEWLVELNIRNYSFKGHVDLSELDSKLVNYHLLIGMGTSSLEGAKLRIPSLMMNASYEILISEKVRLKWLFEIEENQLGKIVKNKDRIIDGKNISDILDDINTPEKWKIISDKCYSYWYFNHSPFANRKAVDDILQKNTFYFTKKIKILLRKDLIGYLIDYIKTRLK